CGRRGRGLRSGFIHWRRAVAGLPYAPAAVHRAFARRAAFPSRRGAKNRLGCSDCASLEVFLAGNAVSYRQRPRALPKLGRMSTSVSPQVREISIAHSPDSDDAFMFYGLATNKVRVSGLKFTHTLCDIETLNRKAMEGFYDVSAISFHA